MVENRQFYYPFIRRPRYGGPRRNIAMFGTEKLERCGCTRPTVKKFDDMYCISLRTVFELFDVGLMTLNNIVTLNYGLEVTQDN